MSLAEVLKDVPLFSELEEEALAALIEVGEILNLPPNALVFSEGDRSEYMYVILKGGVRVSKRGTDGTTVEIGALGEGAFFGEMALLDQGPRSASVETVPACRFFVLGQAPFRDMLESGQHRRMASSVFSTLVVRMRDLMERFFEQELARRTLKAEMEANRLRAVAEMVAGVAHELNTPLGVAHTAIDMVARRIQRSELTAQAGRHSDPATTLEETREAADLALRNIRRAHALVGDFKKISVHQIVETRALIDLGTLIEDAVELFKLNARRSKLSIELKTELAEHERRWEGYAGPLTQVLTNLLTNVERYAYPAGEGGPVCIALDSTPLGFQLSVADEGTGISDEVRARLFEPFFTTGRDRGGTGLGLAIVDNIVREVLKGGVKVESAPGRGARFVVSFPAPSEPEAGDHLQVDRHAEGDVDGKGNS